jgi:2-polyprenyl-3-methyl-5-hydroxy-6-metoxy-1,4-benzoquinol methylase
VLLERCGDVRGVAALDLACGHGVVARWLAREGAHVDAVDLSPALLEAARRIEQDAPVGIRYHLGDAANCNVLSGHRYDLVVCNFGLSDIDDLAGVCANVGRWLRPTGRFVASLLHPCFGGADDVSASWPSDGGYWDERWWRADGARSTLRQAVGANHRTMSTYINTLRLQGLVLDALDEPRPEPAWTIQRPAAALRPVYLVLTCRPLPST